MLDSFGDNKRGAADYQAHALRCLSSRINSGYLLVQLKLKATSTQQLLQSFHSVQKRRIFDAYFVLAQNCLLNLGLPELSPCLSTSHHRADSAGHETIHEIGALDSARRRY